MKLIPLTQGKFTIVDDSDYEWLNQWKWTFCNGYAVRNMWLIGENKGNSIFMHRTIGRISLGIVTDHEDENTLNNQKYNLRSATRSQVCAKRKKFNGVFSSKYKGVSWVKKRKHWRAMINVNGKGTYLGSFIEELDAAMAYDSAAIKQYGEFARLNLTSLGRWLG